MYALPQIVPECKVGGEEKDNGEGVTFLNGNVLMIPFGIGIYESPVSFEVDLRGKFIYSKTHSGAPLSLLSTGSRMFRADEGAVVVFQLKLAFHRNSGVRERCITKATLKD